MHRDVFRTSPWRAYGFAVAAWGAAFAVRHALAHWFAPGFPFLTFFPAVVLAAYFAGLRPAIVTATLSGLTGWWLWIGPPGPDLSEATLIALAFYVFVVAVDIFFIVGMDEASRQLAVQVERNAALAKSRDLLLREVQHRVSNNIQVVSALLKLEARTTSDAGARRVLDNAAARTAMIARLQRNLLDSDGRAVPFDVVAREVIDDALALAGRSDVTVEIEASDAVLGAEEATPVVLIMLESVNNALEHAFPDRGGRVQVRLQDSAQSRRLTVEDDGVGLAPGFDPAAAQSLGLRILSGLAQQLGGRYDIAPSDPGAVAVLTWPRTQDATS
ncbi:histidine kinase dimerization/phosphoacceptor domain -containing protein [Caulobacter segnis]|uniref:sensor histidine kinase n=1 Tax=Caulobacter segnis TaxID=88688 RepID=UPI00240F0633|nr:histidine kinase dimerization/phosphoacceptor domain -containing protein [Caulobacter segnis]MDG2520481.1 histidine kinase dimerization/phosphoacceptor domain -containing protein [Caulobacter segnis]